MNGAFDYDLPEELIAQEPLADRSASRLLHLDKTSGEIQHLSFVDAIRFLNAGDVLVLNDTRVSARRLFGHLETGGAVEALLTERLEPGRYLALTKPAKKLTIGRTVDFGDGLACQVTAVKEGGLRELQFESPTADKLIEQQGLTPLPPYIHSILHDPSRYQTVYANSDGSAAAPTAGLHFTDQILESAAQKGVKIAKVTLDVSIDTFRPMTADRVEDHEMHGERCAISPETAREVNEREGRVIAVGTTTVRTLESFASESGEIEPGEAVTKIFIHPGYRFKLVDGMFTNFHMPKTTMLLMISALVGAENVREAYNQAVERRYRFLSFGDSMLIC